MRRFPRPPYPLWVPPIAVSGTGAVLIDSYGNWRGAKLDNASNGSIHFLIPAPHVQDRLTKAEVLLHNTTFGTGHIYRRVLGEAVSVGRDAGSGYAMGTFTSAFANSLDFPSSEGTMLDDITGLLGTWPIGRHASLVYNRDATNAADTIDNAGGGAKLLVLGLKLMFNHVAQP